MVRDGLAVSVQSGTMDSQAKREARLRDLDTMPRESWWVGMDRIRFYEHARAQLDRMRRSRYGRVESLSTASNYEPPPRARTPIVADDVV